MTKTTSNGFGISRRTLLAGATFGAAQIASPFVITARAAESIKIGLLLPKSGTYAVQGEIGQHGAQIAIDDFGGKVLDRPIQLVWLDESTPQATQQNMRKLLEEEKVVAVQGGVSSGDVLAIMPVAERAKTLLMATGPNATEITGKNCSKYTFRVDLPNKVTVNSVYPLLKEHGKKWYFVVASYAWGIDAYNQMKEVVVKDGGNVVGYDQAPLGTTDFSSYLLKVRQAKPDVIYVGLGGTDLTNFLKQMKEIGLTNQMALSAPIVNDTDLWSAGPDAAFGVYPKIWNYTGSHMTKRSTDFVEAFKKKYNQPPEAEGWQDWFGMTSILTAIKETKSTDSAKLVGFLEEHKFDGYKDAPIFFRNFDHQLVQPLLVAQVKDKISDKYDYFDIKSQYPNDSATLDAAYGSQAEIGCTFKT
ncbi:ABC transporter substrate-binding protein [Bradyrhizobium cenepequi]|uniref:ABC transporter substrate-binding protein n=1 Tax=Bradyrhizobium cenepequi TaxID=2821403 RepID=UPI001CE28121|nr:ABC transporter substrate-binding protein [Bradyrhizobium cenepequi]MCA6112227.1 ABC transporter substrate-binding protein [Bradyrhizobium cenepequi]